ncbi:hypothetical protein B0T22DRAFT_70129 [Podospora appendiculata]|uniref:Uncharacterized protein n=1 Tax=Podospora appendiculata TaxID=314037 RepID=A0AAE0XJ71_9PEZI|nr:hypothetical protein B0T22DRAFT_70129 [Podospora appendiculata]
MSAPRVDFKFFKFLAGSAFLFAETSWSWMVFKPVGGWGIGLCQPESQSFQHSRRADEANTWPGVRDRGPVREEGMASTDDGAARTYPRPNSGPLSGLSCRIPPRACARRFCQVPQSSTQLNGFGRGISMHHWRRISAPHISYGTGGSHLRRPSLFISPCHTGKTSTNLPRISAHKYNPMMESAFSCPLLKSQELQNPDQRANVGGHGKG